MATGGNAAGQSEGRSGRSALCMSASSAEPSGNPRCIGDVRGVPRYSRVHCVRAAFGGDLRVTTRPPRPHGTTGSSAGSGATRNVALVAAVVLGLGALAPPPAAAAAPSVAIPTASATASTSAASSFGVRRVVRVPEDVATLRQAIATAQAGDAIVLGKGTYDGGIVVPPDKHDLLIRGIDRNAVVFDGRDISPVAIEVHADRVALENLAAHNFKGNGFEWEGVDGFSGRYLSVWNVELYGMYATTSRNGILEHDLVSGAADAGFYIGECQPCDTVVRDVVARYSAVGYSGTNAGGNLVVRDSTWERNGTGILPNSYTGQAIPPPERATLITGNTIRDSGSVPVPAHSPLAGFVGLGIGVAGGSDNTITANTVTGSANYGIALFPTLQQDGSAFAPSGNVVRNNDVTGSGLGDLAVASGSGAGNCFAANTFGSSLPGSIENVLGCGTTPTSAAGDESVAGRLAIPVPDALDRLGTRPDYTTMPVPPPEASSPEPVPRPVPSADPSPVGAVVAALVLVGLLLAGGVLITRRRQMRRPTK